MARALRIAEGLQLRVKELDFAHRALVVREGKGGKDRVLMLPQRLVTGLREQLGRAHALWAADQAQGQGGVQMPDALERKYPRAGASWPWFWVFPQATHSVDPRSGVVRRHHLLQAGGDIRTVQDLLGHADVSTAMIYTHVLKVGGGGVQSPLDRMIPL